MEGKKPMTVTTQQTDASHFEKCLITHCSPVLAGIKSANLMNITVTAPQCFLEMLLSYDRTLREKGVSVTLLRYENHRALVYVYREQKLLKELQKPGVAEFLQAQGYSSLELEDLLSRLRERLQMKLVCFWVTLSMMLWASLKMKAEIVAVSAVGKYMTVFVKRKNYLPNFKNAEKFIPSSFAAASLCCG